MAKLKYEKLIKENQILINKINKMEAGHAEIKERLNEAYEAERINQADYKAIEAIEAELENSQIALHQAQEALTQIVDEAYWDVPYAKPRNQGIAKFWEMSGLSLS